jgi:hypothetical protein
MSIKFLAEVNTSDIDVVIQESKNGKPKEYYIAGPFMQADIRNRNGRIYPLHILTKECQRYNENYIQKKRALGQLGHPPDTTTVEPDKVSHCITSLKQQDKNFMGKAKILDTPMGKIVKNFIDEGITLGVSTRGFGTVEEYGGATIVNDDFQLSTVDIVHDPSGYECFVENIMESKEFYWNNGILVEKQYDDVKKLVKNAKSEEKLFEELEKFFNTL